MYQRYGKEKDLYVRRRLKKNGGTSEMSAFQNGYVESWCFLEKFAYFG